MIWAQTAAHYQSLLRAALNVQRHALHVADVKIAGVPSQLRQALIEGIMPVQHQLDRLEKGEFRIAVVGLEKAGKSTFVNAWLESDLLPTANKRCTFTTTQIYSVTDPAEQRLEVIAKTAEQFDAYVKELRQVAQGSGETAKRAREDLDTIEQHRSSLNSVIDQGNQKIRFTHMEEIAQSLVRYVADASVAHAIDEVRFYTTRLAQTDGIVFFDVPGLNSGLGKHLEESRAMLGDCDAVICVQYSKRPNLEAHEQKLVDFVREGDEAVGIAGKLFVFAGQIDLQGSTESLQQDMREIEREWKQRGQLSSDHIVAGSAAAFLLLTGAANDNSRKLMGTPDEMRCRIVAVCELADRASDEQVKQATGIPKIRQRIKRYLDEERSQVIKKRCDEPIARLLRTGREIHRLVAQRYSENPDEVRRQEENRLNIEFQKWWGKRWQEIEAEVNRYYSTHFDADNAADGVTSVKQLRQRYQEFVHTGLSQLPALDPKRVRNIFDIVGRAGSDPPIANDRWREELYDQDITSFLDRLAQDLSLELLNDTRKYVAFMREQLWGSDEVEKRIHREEELKIQIESGLRTLFLRFARPVAEALIRGPLASERRKEIVRKLGSDIELVDNYYQGNEPAFKHLKRYVKYGRALTTDPVVQHVVLGIASQVPLGNAMVELTLRDVEPKPATTEEEVIAEVDGDLRALETYLADVVFAAAGFGAFVSQEIKRLRDEFASNRSTWAGVVLNEYEAENPRLLAELPPELKQPVFDVEISERLRQLRLALEDASQVRQ
jgi:hypothetical protein